MVSSQAAARSTALSQALACFKRREIEDALRYFEEAPETHRHPLLHLNERWTCWMLLGEFEQAWRESDRVALSCQSARGMDGRCVLIQCRRGFGDAIQFLRYGPLIRARRIAVQAPERLLSLLKLAPFIDEAVSLESGTCVSNEVCIECSGLPYLFRSSVRSLPPPLSLLGVFRGSTRPAGPFRIGLKWSAGQWNPIRQIPVAELGHELKSLLDIPGTEWISLEQDSEGATIGQDLGSVQRRACGSLLETARRIAELDLVVTVDTMIAHLAGTLGRPVWILLPYESDWRWMLGRSDSPWYPTGRLFRQPRRGGWDGQLANVGAALRSQLCSGAATCQPQRPG